MPHHRNFKTLDEMFDYINDIKGIRVAYRSYSNPETNEYWVEIDFIEGEVIRPLLEERC